MNAIKDLVRQWNELNKEIEDSKDSMIASDVDILMAKIKMLEISVNLTRLQMEEQEIRRKGNR